MGWMLDAGCWMLDAAHSRRPTAGGASPPPVSNINPPTSRLRNPMPDSAGTISTDWRQLYPFQSHWMELSAGRMHYLDEAPAPPNGVPFQECLLFVHGNPTWSFHWRQLIAALRDRYRCVAPDHLGCGLSDKPVRLLRLQDHIDHLTTFVEKLGLQRLTLVAQDWGGAIGLGTMLRRCAELDRIVLFNTGAYPPAYIPWRIRACRLPIFGRLAVRAGNLFSRAALRMTLARRRRLEPAVEAGYLFPYSTWKSRLGVYGFVHDIPRRDNHPTWHVLAEIECALPTLANVPAALIWGMKDWCFRPDCLERFRSVWPNAQVHPLADVGHWVVEDAPQDVLYIVSKFLERTSEDLQNKHEVHEEPNVA
jgi:haloalkane dehalogenase